MNVFLIYIRDPQFFSVSREPRVPGARIKIVGMPPIGIMSLSAVLKRAGHRCTMFDQANPETPDAFIIDEIARQKPDLVGISFLSTTSYPYAKKLAHEIRAANKDVRLAFGGVYASLNAGLIKEQCPDVTFICRGDGEELILDLLSHLDEPAKVAGLTWSQDGRVVHNPDRPLNFNLDQWPFPDRESLPLDYVEAMPLDVPVIMSKRRFTVMQTSRGCPCACAYCNIPTFGQRKWRSRSARHVLDELSHLQKLGYGVVYFVDDNFLLQPKRIEDICQGIQDRNITIEWGCEGRVDSVAQHLFPIMSRAHCRSLMFGIESGSQRVLDRLNKKQTLEQIRRAVSDAKDAGIRLVHGFFVVGSPDEKVEDIRATFDFAAKIRLDTYSFNRLCVYRTTPLWDEYVKRGCVDDKADWDKYFKCSDIDPTCLPGPVINRERQKGFSRIFVYKLTHYPIQTVKLVLRLTRYMAFGDIVYLIFKPFMKGNRRVPAKQTAGPVTSSA